jgi:hypothetical protein
MRFLKDLSIRHKLLAFSLLTSGIVLVLSFIAFASRDISFRRDSLERELLAIGEIIGRNSVAAVVFDDRDDAIGTLKSLSVKPYVQTATRTSRPEPPTSSLPTAAGRTPTCARLSSWMATASACSRSWWI